MTHDVTGVSAVNADGEVLVFCNAGYCDLAYFTIDGREMRFFTANDEAEHFAAVFGKLSVETASVRGDVVVCFPGPPDRFTRVPIRYGL
jgi:uncharacterized protein YhbP (UPF0306 family)|nr:hypothetical protein [Neorhizobium tomejilense]